MTTDKDDKVFQKSCFQKCATLNIEKESSLRLSFKTFQNQKSYSITFTHFPALIRSQYMFVGYNNNAIWCTRPRAVREERYSKECHLDGLKTILRSTKLFSPLSLPFLFFLSHKILCSSLGMLVKCQFNTLKNVCMFSWDVMVVSSSFLILGFISRICKVNACTILFYFEYIS